MRYRETVERNCKCRLATVLRFEANSEKSTLQTKSLKGKWIAA